MDKPAKKYSDATKRAKEAEISPDYLMKIIEKEIKRMGNKKGSDEGETEE